MVHELHHSLEIFECNILEDDYWVLAWVGSKESLEVV
jgi:hypothetical protein